MKNIEAKRALDAMPECPVKYCTIREAAGENFDNDETDIVNHVECRCKDGQKYAPVVIDGDRDDITFYIEWAINNADFIRAALQSITDRADVEPIGYIIGTYLDERKAEYQKNGIVMHVQPSGMATTPVYSQNLLGNTAVDTGWMPIEKIKVGQSVLAYENGSYFEATLDYEDDDGRKVFSSKCGQPVVYDVEPTHFMTLPVQPE